MDATNTYTYAFILCMSHKTATLPPVSELSEIKLFITNVSAEKIKRSILSK